MLKVKNTKMCRKLKIKSKHLSLEAHVIRFEERKLRRQFKEYVTAVNFHSMMENVDPAGGGPLVEVAKTEKKKAYAKAVRARDEAMDLANHRRWDVRNENRATFLARAFIKGTPYTKVEKKRARENESAFRCYILPRVASMVAKYDPRFANMAVPQEDGSIKYYRDKDKHRAAIQDILKSWSYLP